ncbi:MAG: hypothetical protein ACYS5V_01760 [Planctomycetota bacterium]|jgi:valyl-tRNA synthetase
MDMETVYDPKAVESEIYRRWLEAGVFHADPAPPERFTASSFPRPTSPTSSTWATP